jgi:hypothetical protein
MVIDGFLSVRRTGNGMPLLSSLPAAAEADRNARRLAEGLYNDHGRVSQTALLVRGKWMRSPCALRKLHRQTLVAQDSFAVDNLFYAFDTRRHVQNAAQVA